VAADGEDEWALPCLQQYRLARKSDQAALKISSFLKKK
jgi:hypothetical protein